MITDQEKLIAFGYSLSMQNQMQDVRGKYNNGHIHIFFEEYCTDYFTSLKLMQIAQVDSKVCRLFEPRPSGKQLMGNLGPQSLESWNSPAWAALATD